MWNLQEEGEAPDKSHESNKSTKQCVSSPHNEPSRARLRVRIDKILYPARQCVFAWRVFRVIAVLLETRRALWGSGDVRSHFEARAVDGGAL